MRNGVKSGQWNANYLLSCFRGVRFKGFLLNIKIRDAKGIVCSPGRNFVTLKITTEDGIHGLGDATLNGRELAVASYAFGSRGCPFDRTRGVARRGQLALSLPGRALAARAGDEGI